MPTLTESNVRPGRPAGAVLIRSFANWARSQLYFTVRCPWVKRRGFTRIPWSVSLWSPHRDITFGDRVQFGPGCVVHCDAAFGSNILIGHNVAFLSRDAHRYDVVGCTIWDSPRGDTKKCEVEDDVWIGHGAIILTGVVIGRGSVIAAGAVVTESVARYSIVGGCPAKLLSSRFTAEEIQQHEALLGYSARTSR